MSDELLVVIFRAREMEDFSRTYMAMATALMLEAYKQNLPPILKF
jgi:hypothetical protein